MLRAETNIESALSSACTTRSRRSSCQPGNARAHWLQSRALTALGQHEKAVPAAAAAVRLDPRDARYRVTKAQTMQRTGQIAEAATEAEKAIALSESRPHVKARAICLLGDLRGSGPNASHKQALELHTQALQAANVLIFDKHPAIRVAAKELSLDAHLGALQDIAWGAWREKEHSAENWIAKATEVALDLVKNEEGSDEYLFRLDADPIGQRRPARQTRPGQVGAGRGPHRRDLDFRRPGTRPQGRIAMAGGHVAVRRHASLPDAFQS